MNRLKLKYLKYLIVLSMTLVSNIFVLFLNILFKSSFVVVSTAQVYHHELLFSTNQGNMNVKSTELKLNI